LRQTAHGINEGLVIRSYQCVEKVESYRFYLVHGDLTYPNGLRKASHGVQTPSTNPIPEDLVGDIQRDKETLTHFFS
jgi:hypothetical protein